MNFLAHLYLSNSFDETMVGNLIADSIKGNSYLKYSEGIQSGILLHRKIDKYTDCHPVFCSSKNRLIKSQGKFSGIVTDIFYDHFLAKNWKNYSDVPLEAYAEEVYRHLMKNFEILPEIFQFILPRMIDQNWLVNYSHFNGIDKTLAGLSYRSKFPSNMKNAIHELKKDYLLYENEFVIFFTEIQQYVKTLKE